MDWEDVLVLEELGEENVVMVLRSEEGGRGVVVELTALASRGRESRVRMSDFIPVGIHRSDLGVFKCRSAIIFIDVVDVNLSYSNSPTSRL